jgi:hypothetical protein
MTIVRTYTLRFHNGETGSLHQLDDGSWACPICGEAWVRYPPYYPNDGELGPHHDRSSANLGETCPGCDTEFGYDECMAPTSPVGAFRKRFSALRLAWLDREQWSDTALEQLRDHLGIAEAELRKAAEELK